MPLLDLALTQGPRELNERNCKTTREMQTKLKPPLIKMSIEIKMKMHGEMSQKDSKKQTKKTPKKRKPKPKTHKHIFPPYETYFIRISVEDY